MFVLDNAHTFTNTLISSRRGKTTTARTNLQITVSRESLSSVSIESLCLPYSHKSREMDVLSVKNMAYWI